MNRVRMVIHGSKMKGCVTVFIPYIWICPRVCKNIYYLKMTKLCSDKQRGAAIFHFFIYVRSHFNKGGDCFSMPVMRCPK